MFTLVVYFELCFLRNKLYCSILQQKFVVPLLWLSEIIASFLLWYGWSGLVINYYNFLLTKDFLARGYRTKSCHHYCSQTFLDHIHGIIVVIIIIIIIILYSPTGIKIPICNSYVFHTLTCLCSMWSNLCSTFCDAHRLSTLVAFLLYSKKENC